MGDDPIPYVQSFTNMKDNKKWRRLERQNREIPMPLLFGCVHLVWHQVAKEAPTTGLWDLSRTTPDDVFEMGREESEAMVAALVEADYLERIGINEVRVPNWEEVYSKVLQKRANRAEQPRDKGGRFASNGDRAEPSRTVTEPDGTDPDGDGTDPGRNGAAADRKPLPKPKPLPYLEGKESNACKQRDGGRARKGKLVGDLTGEPSQWDRYRKLPTECGYEAIDSPVPDLDADHRWTAARDYNCRFRDRSVHRQYFKSVEKPKVVMVAWPDVEWVDDLEERTRLLQKLEEAGYEPYGAIVPRIKAETLPDAEAFLDRFLAEKEEARAGPEE